MIPAAALADPTTSLTDFALGALTAALGLRLCARERRAGQLSRGLLGAGLLSVSAVALLGGAVHGFAPRLAVPTKSAIWGLIYSGIGLAMVLVLAALAVAALPRRVHPWILAALGSRLLAGVAFPAAREPWLLVLDFALAVLALLGAGLDLWLRRRETAGGWILAAALVSLLGGFAQLSRFAPHPLFNHNDLFHVALMAGLYLFYRGGLLLRDRGGGRPS